MGQQFLTSEEFPHFIPEAPKGFSTAKQNPKGSFETWKGVCDRKYVIHFYLIVLVPYDDMIQFAKGNYVNSILATIFNR